MNAEIITIGDELLIGQTVDTNSAWIARQLNASGISVTQITSISDSRRHIISALDEAMNRAGLVIMTGGIGPTKDDITKQTLCEYFDTELETNQEVLAHITQLVKRWGKTLESNRRQAELPKDCTILHNAIGTAAGMWFEKSHVVFIALPGVPFEMKHLVQEQVLPRLKEIYRLPIILHKNIMTFGWPEAMLSEALEEWQTQLPPDISVAFLPSPHAIKIRLSVKGKDREAMQTMLDTEVGKVKDIIPHIIFGYDETTMQQVVGNLLKENEQTVATAESCSGGYIAHLLTSLPGSSAYFEGSVVAYSNAIKHDVLGVSKRDLDEHGAVSQQVVEQMALGAQRLLNTGYALATSGVAGPDGGSDEKPVGYVWIAMATPNGKVQSKQYQFSKSRERNIIWTSLSALNMLRRQLLKPV